MQTEQKLGKLKEKLLEMESVVVAYSGGIDSTLMLKIAYEVLGDRSAGVTAVSASLPTPERLEAEQIAQQIGAPHYLIESHETEDENYLANTPNRCFFCKSDVYGRLVEFAQNSGYHYVVDGTNHDDVGDHRPGRQAARKYGVRSPLQEVELTKEEIRQLAHQYNLPNWDKPASACLSSRIPYGTTITVQMLSHVEQAEIILHQMGFQKMRVRHHGDIARIEVEPEQFTALIEQRTEITARLKEIGYAYVTMDLAGFRSGSMNEVLGKNGRK